MATWTLTAQLTTGTLSVGATDRVWWNGATFGTNVVVGSYQDSTHISNNTDTHTCTTNHVHNTKYVDATHYILDGGGSTLIAAGTAPTTAQAGLKFNFSDAASVVTSAAQFYFFNGTVDATGMVGVTPHALECGASGGTGWDIPNAGGTPGNVNGNGNALNLAGQTTSTSHDFFIATSVTPTATGAKTGQIKIILTYV